MFKIVLLLVTSLILVSSCSENEVDLSQMKANGGAKYGGEFRFMSSEKITCLFPVATAVVYNQRILCQIFESPLAIDAKTNDVIPSVASSFTISEDAKTFTLNIREGIFFHDNECFAGGEGRELTAEDVKYTLDFACSGLKINQMSGLFLDKIKGAKEFNRKSNKRLPSEGVSGIKVKNNSVIINLIEPFVGFDKILTHTSLGIFPRESYEMYADNIVLKPTGTGPFKLESTSNKEVILARNNKYWKKDDFGNQLPFIEKLRVTYSTNKKSELIAFRNKKIDLVLEIPVDEIENILGSLEDAQAGMTVKHKIDSKNSLSITYLGISNTQAPFNDKNVRKAINLGINKEEIINKYLKGEGYPCNSGFVPKIEGYPYEKVRGFKSNILLANQLLSKAGFPNGQGFPIIDIYLNAQKGNSVYELFDAVKKQLKQNLNIKVNLKLCTLDEREKAIKSGKALLWSGGWIADYPDPENFLDFFASKHNGSNSSSMNTAKFNSVEYDKLLNLAIREKNEEKRNDYFVKCDQLLIDEAVIMPLINDDFITMINSKIKNFETSSMETLDFTRIFIKEPKK